MDSLGLEHLKRGQNCSLLVGTSKDILCKGFRGPSREWVGLKGTRFAMVYFINWSGEEFKKEVMGNVFGHCIDANPHLYIVSHNNYYNALNNRVRTWLLLQAIK